MAGVPDRAGSALRMQCKPLCVDPFLPLSCLSRFQLCVLTGRNGPTVAGDARRRAEPNAPVCSSSVPPEAHALPHGHSQGELTFCVWLLFVSLLFFVSQKCKAVELLFNSKHT